MPNKHESGNEFPPIQYKNIGLDELVTYCIFTLASSNIQPTFENIVWKAFTLFPERFELRGYPDWPDSLTVNRSWLRCRTDKHYIRGSVKDGFHLTPNGIKKAEYVNLRLRMKTSARNELTETVPRIGTTARSELTETRNRSGRLVRFLEQSDTWNHFKINKAIDGLEDHVLTDMINCMPDSQEGVISKRIEDFSQAAESYERPELVQLLALVRTRLVRKK